MMNYTPSNATWSPKKRRYEKPCLFTGVNSDNGNYIEVSGYSYSTTIAGCGVHLRNNLRLRIEGSRAETRASGLGAW